jgi:hypothetical protein
MKTLRPRLTFANVVAVIALFVALGGTGLAASQLGKNSVGSRQLKKNAVITAKIKNGAVTGAKSNARSLGTVPTAVNATHAENATLAGSIAAPEAPHLVGAPGEPQFATKWENGAPGLTPVSFYKDREGVVHLEGLATGVLGETPDLVFTLPSGYRPNGDQLFLVWGYPGGAGGPDLAVVKANGEVHAGNELEVSLSGITFRAGQ